MDIFKRIIGVLILLMVFGGLFLHTVNIVGLIDALIAWGIAMLLTAIIFLGVYLLIWD